MHDRAPLKLDLAGLFQPLMPDGIAGLDDLTGRFTEAHHAVVALRSTRQLGFSGLPEDTDLVKRVCSAAEPHLGKKNVVVFGIGGSALGAKSIYQALRGHHPKACNGARLVVLDNPDPDTLADTWTAIGNEPTLSVFVSKSGNTSETLAQYLWLKKHDTKFNGGNCLVITDAHEGCLKELAVREKITALEIPRNVGGRFSVFSAAGLLPLAAVGIDIEEMMNGARHAEEACRNSVLARNPAGLLALTLDFWFHGRGITQLAVMPYADRLAYFSDWVAQLFAESLNKKRDLNGAAPPYGMTVLKALGATDQHSQLQLYLDGARDKVVLFVTTTFAHAGELGATKSGDDRLDFLAGKNLAELVGAEKAATEACLGENHRPHATVKLPALNAFELGQLYQTFMNVVPYLGCLMGINAYDQPAVERIKKFTFGLMGRKGFEDFQELWREGSKGDGFEF